MSDQESEFKVVLGVIGADCHAVGNKIIAATLISHGIEVDNLGVMVSQDEFIAAAVEGNADAILVSSIYGHGEIDCQGFRTRCEERGLTDIVLYVGGNLVIGKRDFSAVEETFKEMGFDRVFKPSVDLDDVVRLLKDDVYSKRLPPSYGHNSGAFRGKQFDELRFS
ncbi:methylaspartate mutase subunit S [Pelagibius sp. Alg239-R121]|uniref:methylaspartate mutase subunit S n=1 Tax=Pelagibius sp. Alg239-R121 TaxID=2993448 RepID=UPI0024A70523|nr:methylaspartate mutase subunit S [Pelagibius sp. Alg239-R121]